MNLSDIRHLFDYTEWANDLAMNAAANLSPEHLQRDFGISHGSILGTLRHMAGAEWIWLERWHGHSPLGPDAWGPWTVEQCGGLPELRKKWQAISDRRHQYLAAVTDAELPRELGFRRINGDAYSLPLGHQMQHVVNHATLHRGQVVGLIRQSGSTPPATDLLFYLMKSK